MLREELERVEESTVGQHLVVKVGAGRTAGRADASDQITALDVVTLMNLEAREMSVASLEPESVIDDDQIEIEIADDVRIRQMRQRVTDVRAKGEPVKEAATAS